MQAKLEKLAIRLWPELAHVDEEKRSYGIATFFDVAYTMPLALVSVVWLLLISRFQLMLEAAPAFLLLLVLYLGLNRLSFGLGADDDEIKVRVAPGWLVSWSAVFIFGPTAVWIQLVATVLESIYLWQKVRKTAATPRQPLWTAVRFFSIEGANDMLPTLIAAAFYVWWGGIFPIPGLSLTAVLPALYANLVRIVVFILITTPSLIVYTFTIPRTSLVSSINRFSQLLLSIFILYILPEPLGIFAAGLQVESGWPAYYFFFVAFLIFSYPAIRLNRSAERYQHRSHAFSRLSKLAQTFLNQPLDELDLSPILADHLPDIFPDSEVEIRLFPNERIYPNGEERPLLSDQVWQTLANSSEPYLLWRPPAGPSANGRGQECLLVPIRANPGADNLGGICTLPADNGKALDHLPAARILAAQLSAALNQRRHYDELVDSLSEAYQEEIYNQAYQAAAYSQALEYQKMTQELAVAGRIQAGFLPKRTPEPVGWDIAVTLEPARETSGDFYDFIPLPDGRLGLLIADVADKGIGPALYMALSRTLIRTYAQEYPDQPHKALAAANHRILTDTDSDLFVTAIYAVLDTHTGAVSYCNAGHNPPIWVQTKEAPQLINLERTAIPLGILEDTAWECASFTLNPGDALILYTDGIVEAQDEDQNFFDEERLHAVIQAHHNQSADLLESRIIDAVYDFVGDAPQFDDITLMVIKRE